MERKLKENIGLYSMGVFSAIIAIICVLANTFYAETGGYGVGFAIVAICAFIECFLFSFSTEIARVRSKGLISLSFEMTFGYLILFILGDLAYIPAMTFNFDGSKYARVLQPLGVGALVFEIICLLILLLISIRLLANLCGKEFKKYEAALGTPIVRRKEGEVAAEEMPRKDTARLFSEADEAYLSSKMKVVELVRKDMPIEEFKDHTTREETPLPIETEVKELTIEEASENPIEEAESLPTDNEDVVEAEEKPSFEEKSETTSFDEQEVEIAESVNQNVVAVLDDADYNEIVQRNYDEGYANDVRRDYIPSHTVQKEYQDDDIYTDFSYGSDENEDTPRS